MNILGIETSCDETAAAVISCKNGAIEILSNIVSSQANLHAEFGGVVPSLAAREHVKNIIPVIDEALNASRLVVANIDLISVTSGPGLIPALLVGVNAAKSLAYAWKSPLLGIHHIEGHIYANFASRKISGVSNSKPLISKEIKKCQESNNLKFPILCLVVSGGHTQLVFMKDHLRYEIIGETLDDAVGEAFDKVARILNLGYPGGPAIAEAASKFKAQNSKFKINLPRPMINSDDFNFSFSGLKTAVLYETKKNIDLIKNDNYINALAHEFQQAAIDVLVNKTTRAAKKYNPKTIMLAGGVSANNELRDQLGKATEKKLLNAKCFILDTRLSGDNAAMIAAAAYFQWKLMSDAEKLATSENWKKVEASANKQLAVL